MQKYYDNSEGKIENYLNPHTSEIKIYQTMISLKKNIEVKE